MCACVLCTQVSPLQSYQVHGNDLIISQRGFSSYHPRPSQVLHTQSFILSNDVSDLVPVGQHLSCIHSEPDVTFQQLSACSYLYHILMDLNQWSHAHLTDITAAVRLLSSRTKFSYVIIMTYLDSPSSSTCSQCTEFRAETFL